MSEMVDTAPTGWVVVKRIYLVALALFWGLYLYLAITFRSTEKALNLMRGHIERSWSPTNDPVINFLVDSCIVVVGVVFAAGVVVSGLVGLMYLLFFAVAVCLPLVFILWVASLSAAGAVVAAALALGYGWLVWRFWRGRTSARQARALSATGGLGASEKFGRRVREQSSASSAIGTPYGEDISEPDSELPASSQRQKQAGDCDLCGGTGVCNNDFHRMDAVMQAAHMGAGIFVGKSRCRRCGSDNPANDECAACDGTGRR